MANLDELLARAKSQIGEAQSAPKATTGQYVGNSVKQSIADMIGGVGDTPARLYQLGKAAIGSTPEAALIGRLIGKQNAAMPDVNIPATQMFTDYLKNAIGVQDNMKPADTTDKYLGAAAGGATGGLLMGPVGAAGNTIKEMALGTVGNLAKNAVVGGMAGVGATGGGDFAQSAGVPRPIGEIAGGLLGGVVGASSSGVVGTVLRGKNVLDEMATLAKDPSKMTPEQVAMYEKAIAKTQETAGKIVNKRMESAVQGTPNAADNLTEGLRLRAAIPGFNPSVAEMAQAPAALELQKNFARSSPKALNEEVARVAASEKAIADHFQNALPGEGSANAVRNAINQDLAARNAKMTATGQQTAGKLPTTDLVAMGDKAAALAQAEKAAASPAIVAAYGKAYALAPDPSIDAKPILAAIEKELGMPLAQVKPEVAPRTFAAIQRFIGGDGGKTPEELALLSARLGGNIENAGAKTGMTLQEAAALRRAINADATSASQSLTPLASMRLRNLANVKGSIDEAIGASPIAQEAKDAFAAANHKYSTEFAPRFKEGPNALMFKQGTNNEPRIIADKFIDTYFKADQQGGGTRAENFKNLFGANAESKALMKEGILDRFRNSVVNAENGIIDPAKAAAFQRQYGRTLESFKANGINAMDDIKAFTNTAAKHQEASDALAKLSSRLKFENVDDLANAALNDKTVMQNIKFRLNPDTKDELRRIIMEKARGTGTGKEATGASVEQFLDKNHEVLRGILEPKHESALRDIAKAMQIIEQSPAKGLATTASNSPLKSAIGLSEATVLSQVRAFSGGRQGLPFMGFNLAMPVFAKLSQTKFDDVMRTALHDPQTAVNLRNLLQSTTQAQAAGWGGKLLGSMKNTWEVVKAAKGPIVEVILGVSNYPANLKRSVPAISNVVQDNEER
jgi:hypothetical protein